MFFKKKKRILFLEAQVKAFETAASISEDKGVKYVPADSSIPESGIFIPAVEKQRIDKEEHGVSLDETKMR